MRPPPTRTQGSSGVRPPSAFRGIGRCSKGRLHRTQGGLGTAKRVRSRERPIVSTKHSYYVHGTHPEEQRRLSLLNDILNRGSVRELGLSGGERILDLGCGLGQLTRLMAQTAGPSGRVVGIDRSVEQLEQARTLAREAGEDHRIDFRAGDVLDLSLPESEWGSFDVARTRFVLEHVPNPLAVVRSMVRAVRPGGRIVLEDEDHDILRLWPALPGIERVWRAYMESYVKRGNDPFVGRRLVALLHEAGAKPTRTAPIWFGTSAGEPMFRAWVENFLGVMGGAREEILSTGALDAEAFDEALSSLRDWGVRPDAAAWYFMAYAEGVRASS